MRPLRALPAGAVAGLLALGACTPAAPPAGHVPRHNESSPEPEELLFVEGGGGIRAVVPETGTKSFGVRNATPAPDFSVLYSHRITGDEASLVTIDATSGDRLAGVDAPAGLEFGVASASGEFVVFTEPHEAGVTPWLPAGKKRTKLVVASPHQAGARRTYNLAGNFEVEAFSTDDRELFLLEYTPAMNPSQYRLRRLKLGSGRVTGIERVKQNAPGEMRGTGRIQSFSPTGNELYTLYTQQGPNYAHGGPIDDRPGLTYAFVHLLNLDGGWTHCIDLPMPFGTGPVTTHAFALSADGSRLYVADPSSGGVAVIDPVRMHVRNSTTLNLEPLTRGEASAAVASDGTVYLAGGSQILALDGETLRPIERWRVGREVSGIAASSDGSHVYVGLGRRVGIIESKTGAVSGRIHMTDLESVLRLAAGVE
jgi:hypothetical protein